MHSNNHNYRAGIIYSDIYVKTKVYQIVNKDVWKTNIQ